MTPWPGSGSGITIRAKGVSMAPTIAYARARIIDVPERMARLMGKAKAFAGKGRSRQFGVFTSTLPTCSALQVVGYQRRPQFPQPPRHPPPPRTSLIISSSIRAPIVALMIAAIIPEPRWMPS